MKMKLKPELVKTINGIEAETRSVESMNENEVGTRTG